MVRIQAMISIMFVILAISLQPGAESSWEVVKGDDFAGKGIEALALHAPVFSR